MNWLGHLLLHQWEGPRASSFTGSWLELGKSIWESRILYPGPQASRQDLQGQGEGRHTVPAPTCPWQMPFWVCLVEAEPQTAGGKDSCKPETTWRRLAGKGAAGKTKQEPPPSNAQPKYFTRTRHPTPPPLCQVKDPHGLSTCNLAKNNLWQESLSICKNKIKT